MKQKVLFYGNCHVGAIARFFKRELCDRFDIADCRDCGLDVFWLEESLHAVWSPKNIVKQDKYKDCLIQKIEESDVFIFQDISSDNIIDELQTPQLCNDNESRLNICIPNTRLLVYLNDKIALEPYIKYALTKYPNNPDKVINYLQESSDPKLTDILKLEYPFSHEHIDYRNENHQRYKEDLKKYDTVIEIDDFIKKEFNKQILAIQNNHMSESYYIEVIRRLYKHLNISEEDYPIKDLQYPGAHDRIDPRQFKFFMNYFKDLDFKNFGGRLLAKQDVTKTKHE